MIVVDFDGLLPAVIPISSIASHLWLNAKFVLRLRYSRPEVQTKGVRMNRARLVIVLIMLIVLAVTLAGTFLTSGVMAYLPFLQARTGNWTGAYVPRGVVDQRPWQTAATLAALAQSSEERELARDAERLADHEVDQAFSQSLRQASLEKPNLSGKALALQQRVTELQETIKNDQARIASLSAGAGTKPAGAVSNGSDLEIAKAQLGLDQNELTDSIEDLARESGDQRIKLQQELAARQAAMKQYRDQCLQRRWANCCRLRRTVQDVRTAAIHVAIPPQQETTDCAGRAIGHGRRGRADGRPGKAEDRSRRPWR